MLPNAFLAAIDRNGTTLHAVSPDEVLEVDDILWFAGEEALPCLDTSHICTPQPVPEHSGLC
jgi:hypothetical protein